MASFLPTFGRRGSGSSSVRAGQDPSSSSIASGSLFRVTTSGSVSGATTITAEKDALPGSTPTGAAAGAGASGPSPPAALAGGFSSSSLPEAERGIVGDLVRSLLSVVSSRVASSTSRPASPVPRYLALEPLPRLSLSCLPACRWSSCRQFAGSAWLMGLSLLFLARPELGLSRPVSHARALLGCPLSGRQMRRKTPCSESP